MSRAGFRVQPIEYGVIESLAIGCFKSFEATVLRHLDSLSAFCRHFPDLEFPAAIGTEIDPTPIFRPARYQAIGTFLRETARRTALRTNYEDFGEIFCPRIKGNGLPIRRPTGVA